MIFVDESTMKVGGVILPGLFKSLEVDVGALIEEQEIEGRSDKPKQVTGYEDAKVMLELVLEDGQTTTKDQKLEVIQKLFKKSGQKKPIVHEIINEHTAARGVSRVIFNRLTSKTQNNKSQLFVTLEFVEYIPIVIIASGSSGSSTPETLNTDYQSYLSTRGQAPKIDDKTSQSPAVDDDNVQQYTHRLPR